MFHAVSTVRSVSRRVASSAAAFGLTALLTSAAWAAPLKVESENIVFYGDTTQEAATEIVEKLEIYRKTIFAIANKTPQADSRKLTIYGLDNQNDMTKFVGRKGVAGLYTEGFDGPIFLTQTRKGFKSSDWTEQVTLHEYSHHILHGVVVDDFPRWYDEGFANYLSSFEVEDGIIKIGIPAAQHANGLKRGAAPWVDVEDVLGAIRVYPFADAKGRNRSIKLNQFYAQSWLYVHLIQSSPEYSGKLSGDLKRINAGEEPLAAFEAGFGVSPAEFHKQAKAYWRKNDFKVYGFKASPEMVNIPTKVTPLSDVELELAYAQGQQPLLNDKNAKHQKRRLAKIEGEMGRTVLTQALHAHYNINRKQYDTALTFAQAAVEAAPNDPAAGRMLADAYFHRSHAEIHKDLEPEDIKAYTFNSDLSEAVRLFERTLSLSPGDYNANLHLVGAYGASDVPVTQVALAAADNYEALYLDSADVGGALDLANIFMRGGETDRACALFETAKAMADGYDDKTVNDDHARAELFAQTYGQDCAR